MHSVDSRRISHKQRGENMVNINPLGGREDIPQSIQTWDRCRYLTMCMLCVQCLGYIFCFNKLQDFVPYMLVYHMWLSYS